MSPLVADSTSAGSSATVTTTADYGKPGAYMLASSGATDRSTVISLLAAALKAAG
jgi:hypothetical protein